MLKLYIVCNVSVVLNIFQKIQVQFSIESDPVSFENKELTMEIVVVQKPSFEFSNLYHVLYVK